MNCESVKTFRMLNLYERLNRGEVIKKREFAAEFDISGKSVQRDIDDLRAYLAESYGGDSVTLEYSYSQGGYILCRNESKFLTNAEILGISKILLESRAYNKAEMDCITEKLLLWATPSARMNIKEMILNEKFHYIPPRHGKPLLHTIWDLSEFIYSKKIIKFDYERQDKKITHRTVKPLAIMFSEFYFYLVAWFADDSKDYPAVFRADRISALTDTGEHFKIPYAQRFEEGEFRKRVQFMYTGPLRKIKFEFSGPSLEAILDRIPTARVISQKDGVVTLSAECYGDGVLMWLKTQGDYVKILKNNL